MRLQPRRHPLPFLEQSRRRQRRAYIDIKNRIRRDAGILGGMFTTHHYIDGNNAWVDAYFLGGKVPVFYNLTLETARNAYKDAVGSRAFEQAHELVHEYESPFVLNGAVYEYRPKHYEKLDGLTLFEWIDKQERIIADSGQVQVYEGWRLRYDYTYGIGVEAVVNVPSLGTASVNAFIERFLAHGGGNWLDTTPLTWRADDINWMRVESNAVAEPPEWCKCCDDEILEDKPED